MAALFACTNRWRANCAGSVHASRVTDFGGLANAGSNRTVAARLLTV